MASHKAMLATIYSASAELSATNFCFLLHQEVVEILYSWCSIGCALALKACGGVRTHLISKTQKVFCEILVGVQVIQIISYFNVFISLKLGKLNN